MSDEFKAGDKVRRITRRPFTVAEVAANGRWIRLEDPVNPHNWVLAENLVPVEEEVTP